MDYRRYGNRIVLRLDAGDEICESIIAVADREGIRLGSVSGIGGAGSITLGVFNTEKKSYNTYEYTGTHEITSLTGNITRADGKPYVHLHITAANVNAGVVAGHLLSARISLTAEIFIDAADGEIGRKKNETLGINEMSF